MEIILGMVVPVPLIEGQMEILLEMEVQMEIVLEAEVQVQMEMVDPILTIEE